MKRKDWKTKSLKKDIFGKIRLKKRIFFLRKLLLRKHRTLVRRNLVLNFIFFSNFLINLKKIKKSHINYVFSKSNNNLTFLPDFTFPKKIKNLFLSFKKIQKQFKFQYFIDNSSKRLNNSFGFNLNVIKTFDEKIFDDFLLKDENKNIISKKFFESNEEFFLNFYFSYNLNLINILEIYKIIIILHINNLNKNN